MGIGKQAKVLNNKQFEVLFTYLGSRRNGIRNQVILLLSVKAGLRAKEISALTWEMVLDSDGSLGSAIHLTNKASKGKSGRIIPMNKLLKAQLGKLLLVERKLRLFSAVNRAIRTERSANTSAQVIVNMFYGWYTDLGLVGCSSHSGRRTFVTNAARKIGMAGGSLRDVQALAGHTSLQTTQKYIEIDNEAQFKIVDLI
jgi:integrase/recombinase XerD